MTNFLQNHIHPKEQTLRCGIWPTEYDPVLDELIRTGGELLRFFKQHDIPFRARVEYTPDFAHKYGITIFLKNRPNFIIKRIKFKQYSGSNGFLINHYTVHTKIVLRALDKTQLAHEMIASHQQWRKTLKSKLLSRFSY